MSLEDQISPAIQREIDRANSKIVKSIKEFERVIKSFTRDLSKKAFVIVHKKIAMDALRSIINKTPVDTGRAKGNWQVSVNREVTDSLLNLDKTGQATLVKGVAEIGTLGFGEIVWISNNVDYIIFLENGSSGQAPRGMVAVTIQQLLSEFL